MPGPAEILDPRATIGSRGVSDPEIIYIPLTSEYHHILRIGCGPYISSGRRVSINLVVVYVDVAIIKLQGG